MRPLTISYPDGDERDIPAPDDVRSLAEELDRLGAHPIADSIFSAHGLTILKVADDNVEQIARALEHLHNLEEAQSTSDARTALFSKLRWPPLTYLLRSWEIEGQGKVFFSYTGQYKEGDRLVTMGGDAFRVTEVAQQATPVEDGVLIVERWRDERR